jgi:hypothetical protein
LRQVEQDNPQAARRKRRLATAKKRVAYVERISKPLVETLKHLAALPVNQLAGHAANLDFWIREANHCLSVIDGYQDRFDRLRKAQAEYEKQHRVVSTSVPLRRGAQHHNRQELRQAVCVVVERFLVRCHRENLLSEKELPSALRTLGI